MSTVLGRNNEMMLKAAKAWLDRSISIIEGSVNTQWSILFRILELDEALFSGMYWKTLQKMLDKVELKFKSQSTLSKVVVHIDHRCSVLV